MEDRPALNDVIEITPEMYMAGCKALADSEGEAYEVIIPLVFRAILEAAPETRSTLR